MSDLIGVNDTLPVRLGGVSTSSGLPDNYADVNSNGQLQVKDAADGATGSAVPAVSIQIGGTDGTDLRTITTDTSGNQKIVGNVASASADSGNPVKVGSIYNSTPPLLTNAQRGDQQADENSVPMSSPSKVGYTAMGRAFSASNTAALTVGTSETAIFLFKNPSGSTTKTRLLKIIFSGSATFRVYETPTTTANGTAITTINQRIGSATAANSTPFQSPTATSNGTLWFTTIVSAQTGTFMYFLYHEPIINANNDILITAQAGSNNTSVNAVVFWVEVP